MPHADDIDIERWIREMAKTRPCDLARQARRQAIQQRDVMRKLARMRWEQMQRIHIARRES